MLGVVYRTLVPDVLMLVAGGHRCRPSRGGRVGPAGRPHPSRDRCRARPRRRRLGHRPVVGAAVSPSRCPSWCSPRWVPVVLAMPYLPIAWTRLVTIGVVPVVAGRSWRSAACRRCRDRPGAGAAVAGCPGLLLFFTAATSASDPGHHAVAEHDPAHGGVGRGGSGQPASARASRARVVAAADDARRAIERDVHDGAQQPLLAARMDGPAGPADHQPGSGAGRRPAGPAGRRDGRGHHRSLPRAGPGHLPAHAHRPRPRCGGHGHGSPGAGARDRG